MAHRGKAISFLGEGEPVRTAFLLWFGALLYHGFWALLTPFPMDWDPSYYQAVARHIVEGDGAVIGAVWQLVTLPGALPYPAHQHWMPLPVWVLVPGTWISIWHGAQITTCMLGACWGPLTFLHARDLGASHKTALLAGVLGGSALAHVRFVSTPDSLALYGVIGGVALLLMRKERYGFLAGVLALAALTRNEGFWLSLCLLPWLKRHRWIGVIGPAAALGWWVHNYLCFGDEWLQGRTALSSVLHAAQLRIGPTGSLSIIDRISNAALLGVKGVFQLFFLYLPVVGTASVIWHRLDPAVRADRAVRAAMLYGLTVPFLLFFLSPGIAGSGSVFRSAAALSPLFCAMGAIFLVRLGEWSHRVRGYHFLFLPVLLGIATVVIPTLGNGLLMWSKAAPTPECDILAPVPPKEPVFSSVPLELEAKCRRSGVVWPERGDAQSLATKFGVFCAIVGEGGISTQEVERRLPDWRKVSDDLVCRDRTERK